MRTFFMKTAARMAAAALVLASALLLAVCDNGTTTSPQTYKGSKDGSGYVLVVTGGDYELTITDSAGTHTSTGTVTSGSGTFVLQPTSGNPITVAITETGGITGITVPDGGGIVDENGGSSVTPPGAVTPEEPVNGDVKTLLITGLPADWTKVSVVLTDEDQYDYPAGGYAAVSGGTATVPLKTFDPETLVITGNWTGTGNWYVDLWDANAFEEETGEPAAITKTPVSFSAAQTSVSYADFDDIRGAKVGQIRGTVELTNVPAGAKVYIRASVRLQGPGDEDLRTSSSPVNLSTGAWTIPLYEGNFRNGPPASVTGEKPVQFILRVVLANGSDYEVRDLTKTLDLASKADIQAGNVGARSLKAVTLSGTVTVTYNGQPVPHLEISAYGSSHSGFAQLTSPAANASWSIIMQAFESPTDVTIDVRGYPSKGTQLFEKQNVETVTGVSGADRTNIVIDLGNITSGASAVLTK